MRDPFEPVSQEDLDRQLKEARSLWDSVPDQHKHLIANSDAEFVAKVEAGTPTVVEMPGTPRPLTLAEKASQQQEIDHIDFVTRGILREDPNANLPAPLREQAELEQEGWLEKLGGPARAAQNSFSAMVEDVVKKALAKGRANVPRPERIAIMPRPAADRAAIMPLVRAAVEEAEQYPDDLIAAPLAKFLAAFAENNQAQMRAAVRELVAA